MDSAMLFCQSSPCINPAVGFYFKSNTPFRFCSSHEPSPSTATFPISHSSFLTSLADLSLYYTRKRQSEQGKNYLNRLGEAASTELEAALSALEAQEKRSMQALSESYEAEKRKTKQHFRQVEVAIEQHLQAFENYLLSKSTTLTDLQELMIADDQIVPELLRCRSFNIEFGVSKLVARSATRGERYFDKHLAFFLLPKGREFAGNQLLRLAREARDSDDVVELQKGVAYCSEAVRLLTDEKMRRAASEELSEEMERLNSRNAENCREMLEVKTEDSKSIQELINFYWETISEHKSREDKNIVERLLLQLHYTLLPLSQSKETADVIRKTMDFLLSIYEYDFESANYWYQASLKILVPNFPEDECTAVVYARLSSLSLRHKMYSEAECYIQKAFPIFERLNPISEDTALSYLLLARVQSEMRRDEEATANFQISRSIYRMYYPHCIGRAHTLLYLSEMYIRLNNAGKGKALLKKAITLYNKTDPECFEVAKANLDLAEVILIPKYQESMLLLSLGILQKRGARGEEIAAVHIALGELYCLPTFFCELDGEDEEDEEDGDEKDKEQCILWMRMMRDELLGYYQFRKEEAEENLRIGFELYKTCTVSTEILQKIFKSLVKIKMIMKNFAEAELLLEPFVNFESTDSEFTIYLLNIFLAVTIAQQKYASAESLMQTWLLHVSADKTQEIHLQNDLGVISLLMNKIEQSETHLLLAFKACYQESDMAIERALVSVNYFLALQAASRFEEAEQLIRQLFELKGDETLRFFSFFEIMPEAAADIPKIKNRCGAGHCLFVFFSLYFEITDRNCEDFISEFFASSKLMKQMDTLPEAYTLFKNSDWLKKDILTSIQCMINIGLVYATNKYYELVKEIFFGFCNIPIFQDIYFYIGVYNVILFHLRQGDKFVANIPFFYALFDEFRTSRTYLPATIDLLSRMAHLSPAEALSLPFEPELGMKNVCFSPQVNLNLRSIKSEKPLDQMLEDLKSAIQLALY